MRIIAEISEDFLKKNKDLPEEVIYKAPSIAGGRKFMSIIRRGNSPENYYFFSQRRGKDSIRFILYDKTRTKPFCLLQHLEASQNKIVTSAYSGSNDKDLSLIEICREEVNEESEFTLEDTKRITLVRPMGLGSQTNEIAYLYLVDVDGLSETPMQPENEYEENVNHIWMSLEEVKTKGDWASIVIADSTRILGTDKTSNGQIIAYTIDEKLARLKARRSPNKVIARYEKDGEDYFPELSSERDYNDYLEYLYQTEDLICVKHKKYILDQLPRKPYMFHNMKDFKIDGGKSGSDFILTEKKGLKRKFNLEFVKGFINVWVQTEPRQRLSQFQHKMELVLSDLFS